MGSPAAGVTQSAGLKPCAYATDSVVPSSHEDEASASRSVKDKRHTSVADVVVARDHAEPWTEAASEVRMQVVNA